MGRELPPADDVGAIWFGHGVDLARRVEAFRDQLRFGPDLVFPADVAADLSELLLAEWDPREVPLRAPTRAKGSRSPLTEPGS